MTTCELSKDAVVIGGGPAGSVTALELAHAGWSVTVLERTRSDGMRVGETLRPEICVRLEQLGLWETFLGEGHLSASGKSSAWGAAAVRDNSFFFNRYGRGWHIDRLRFDRMLTQAAQAAGAEVHRGVRLLDVVPSSDQGGWRVTAVADVRPVTLRTCSLVDATGRAAWLARRLGAERVAFDRLVAVVTFFRTPPTQGNRDTCSMVEATEQGWWYSARVPDDRGVLAFMTDADLLPRGRAAIGAFLAHQTARAEETRRHIAVWQPEPSPPRTVAANGSRLDPASGSGWLAVGDAAASFDPLSGQGIAFALESGCRAAETLREGVPRGAKAAYAAWVEQSVCSYREAYAHVYGEERRWPHSVFWSRRRSRESAAAAAVILER